MRNLGIVLLLVGIGLCVLYFMKVDVEWLRWIGNWGEGVAWAIRGGCVALGAILIKVGKSKSKK